MKLRIVSWNCQMALYKKFDQLLSLRPDIAIIQECASPEKDAKKGRSLPCSCQQWIGFDEDKGLGIFSFNGVQINVHPCYSEHFQLYLPVEVSGPPEFHLLGLWMADKRRMPAGTNNEPKEAVEFYRDFLTAKPSVVAGDFNYYIPEEELSGMGLDCANRSWARGDPPGTLPQTHYHKRKLDGRFIAVDYMFVPRRGGLRLSRFDVGDRDEWIKHSDHLPLVADFKIVGDQHRNWLVRLRERPISG